MVPPLGRTVWRPLKMFRRQPPATGAILLPRTWPTQRKTYMHVETCTQLLTAAGAQPPKAGNRPRAASNGGLAHSGVLRGHTCSSHTCPGPAPPEKPAGRAVCSSGGHEDTVPTGCRRKEKVRSRDPNPSILIKRPNPQLSLTPSRCLSRYQRSPMFSQWPHKSTPRVT